MFCDGRITVYDPKGDTIETLELPDGEMPVGYLTYSARFPVSEDVGLDYEVGLN